MNTQRRVDNSLVQLVLEGRAVGVIHSCELHRAVNLIDL